MVLKILTITLLLTVSSDNKKIGINTPIINKEVVTSFKKPVNQELSVCDSSSFASYEDYRLLTRYKQYDLQQLAVTNERGYRTFENKTMIAISSQYGKVGDTLKIYFENGRAERFVIGDIKAVECSHYVNESETSLIEIIVDSNIIKDKHLGKIKEYSYKIIKIEKEN